MYLGFTDKIIKNKAMDKQNQSRSLRDWCEVCAGDAVPMSSNNASHAISLTDGLSNQMDFGFDPVWQFLCPYNLPNMVWSH